MSSSIWRLKALTMIACLTMSSFAVGCKEQDIEKALPQVKGIKASVLSEMQRSPYRQEQHAAIKAYFEKPSELLTLLSEEQGLKDLFSKTLAKKDLSAVCSDALVSRKDWESIMWNCKVNNYFLCAEDVKLYAWTVGQIRLALSAELQKKFDETPSCKQAL